MVVTDLEQWVFITTCLISLTLYVMLFAISSLVSFKVQKKQIILWMLFQSCHLLAWCGAADNIGIGYGFWCACHSPAPTSSPLLSNLRESTKSFAVNVLFPTAKSGQILIYCSSPMENFLSWGDKEDKKSTNCFRMFASIKVKWVTHTDDDTFFANPFHMTISSLDNICMNETLQSSF